MGILIEKRDNYSKVVGIWNLPEFEEIGELVRNINEDLKNIQERSLFETVSLFY